MFKLSTIESKGRSENLFHLRNIQKDVTVNSDLDRRIQKCCFRKDRVEISREFNTNKTFATSGESGLQVQLKRKIS